MHAVGGKQSGCKAAGCEAISNYGKLHEMVSIGAQLLAPRISLPKSKWVQRVD
jgi:hypothetical protein